MEQRLTEELPGRGQQLYCAYVVTREKLVDNIFREIPAIEPNLSDHGPDHIANVLENARRLLSEQHNVHGLSAIELYCLAMIILFHDTGNLFGRKEHHKKIGEVFDWARGCDANLRHEKTLVLLAARAHTGVASDGTLDTLKEVSEIEHLYGESVQLRSIAAILRFADELAEGPQRTSEYRRTRGLYVPDSQQFHDYASIAHVRPDRGTERVRLTYEIQVDVPPAVATEVGKDRLRRILEYTYERAVKLDQERRYARFYSPALAPFKATWIVFNFHCKGELLNVDLPPIHLEDKTIPGDPARTIPEYNARYDAAGLTNQLMQLAIGDTLS